MKAVHCQTSEEQGSAHIPVTTEQERISCCSSWQQNIPESFNRHQMLHTNWGFRDFPTEEGLQAFSPSPCLQRQQTHKRFRALKRGRMHPTRPSEHHQPWHTYSTGCPKECLHSHPTWTWAVVPYRSSLAILSKATSTVLIRKLSYLCPFPDNFTHLHYLDTSALGKSPGIKHLGTMEYWKWWHETPISNVLTSFFPLLFFFFFQGIYTLTTKSCRPQLLESLSVLLGLQVSKEMRCQI